MEHLQVKKEFYVDYLFGHGLNDYLIHARSKREILDRYPLFRVYDLSEVTGVPASGIELMRMYPGPGRPRDLAVQGRSPEERAKFVAAQEALWDEVAQKSRAAGISNLDTPEKVAKGQRWIDIDDDVDFRMAMHDIWQSDPRYQALPPEKRLF